MMYLFIALLLNPNPVVRNHDPPSVEGWEQAIEFRCGGTTLHVTGYGASKPFESVAAITVNETVLEGAAADALRLSLSNRRAVYRLGARCPRERGSISPFIVRGEKLTTGDVAYGSASAFIKENRIESYTGLQKASADDFWFR